MTANNAMENKGNEKPTCLYVSSKNGEYSSAIILKKFESLGFKVNLKSSITVAAKLCSSTRMALIVVEDCEEKIFIEAIKMPNSCNEHTPILFISSGPLSDILRYLMQEQFIDELVFKCPTLECDLGSAVTRLITQPGQFAVTPKTKRPVNVRKRKFETGLPSSKDKKCPDGTAVSHAPVVLYGLDHARSSYHINPCTMTRPATEQRGCDEKKKNFYLPVECTPYYNALRPCPELYFDYQGESSKQAAKEENAEKLHTMSFILGNGHPQNEHQWRASVILKAENVEQSLNSKQNNMESVINNSDITANSKEEYSQSGKSKKDHPDMNLKERERDAVVSSSSSARRNHASRRMTTRRNSRLPACLTALEKKEQHLDKEKKRRERITKSWYWMRQLMPNCDSYADKATVFEMSVAYLHHCWKYHRCILQQINKEFAFLNISSEEMEMNVTDVLEKERKAASYIVD